MPISDAKSFKTSDGRLFEDRDMAKDAEFSHQFKAWWDAKGLPDGPIYNQIVEDRHKLLLIWKELNGGSTIAGITAPRKDP